MIAERVYAAPVVTPSANYGLNTGGLTVFSGFFDSETLGTTVATYGGTARTTTQMKEVSTYAGWDFTNIWSITAGSYPTLRTPASFEHPDTIVVRDSVAPGPYKYYTAGTCYRFIVTHEKFDGTPVATAQSRSMTLHKSTNNTLYASLSDCQSEANAITNISIPPSASSVDIYLRPSMPSYSGESNHIQPSSTTLQGRGLSFYLQAPDSDGDGVTDDVDSCDADPGPGYNGGCPLDPFGDYDGDGADIQSDPCPETWGPPEDNYCSI